jgi:hypothetical protein
MGDERDIDLLLANMPPGISLGQKPRPEYVDELWSKYQPLGDEEAADLESTAKESLPKRQPPPGGPPPEGSLDRPSGQPKNTLVPTVVPDIDISTSATDIRSQLDDLLVLLSADQLKYIEARVRLGTDIAVGREWGKKQPSAAINNWKKSREPKLLKKIINWLQLEKTAAAEEVLRRHLLKAVNVKTGGLDSVDERLRQAAATEILDRTMGKPMQRVEQKTQAEVLTVVVDF